MKTEDIFEKVIDTISNIEVPISQCINILTQKMMIANGDNIIDGVEIIKDEDNEEIDDEMYEKLQSVENRLFYAFGYLVKAKQALGVELDIPEQILVTQFESEMAESLEMYRDFRNTEEILHDGEEDNTDLPEDELEDGEEN